MNQVAATAFTLNMAAQPAFAQYCTEVLANAQALAKAFLAEDVSLITGGTENHLLVLDTIKSFGLDGREAQNLLDEVGITINKQVIPDDPLPPFKGSGIRIGTPAATSRGMGEDAMRQVAHWTVEVLRSKGDTIALKKIESEVLEFCRRYPVPGLE